MEVWPLTFVVSVTSARGRPAVPIVAPASAGHLVSHIRCSASWSAAERGSIMSPLSSYSGFHFDRPHQQIHARLLVLLALRALLTDFRNPILFRCTSECTSMLSPSTYRSYFKSDV